MKGLYRKRLGKWGEEKLDSWMDTKKWRPIQKNKKIKHGEIDRVYQFDSKTFCLAEIKTIYLNSKITELYLFSEIFLQKFIKKRQVLNLIKLGDNLLSSGAKTIYIRIFIICIYKTNSINFQNYKNNTAIKICFHKNNLAIISLSPEIYKFTS